MINLHVQYPDWGCQLSILCLKGCKTGKVQTCNTSSWHNNLVAQGFQFLAFRVALLLHCIALLSKPLCAIGNMLWYAHASIPVAKIVDSIAFACLLKCYVTFQVPLCSHCCCCCSCCTGIIEAAHLRCRTDSLFDSALGKKLRAARSYSHSGPKWPNLRVDTNAAQLRVSKWKTIFGLLSRTQMCHAMRCSEICWPQARQILSLTHNNSPQLWRILYVRKFNTFNALI